MPKKINGMVQSWRRLMECMHCAFVYEVWIEHIRIRTSPATVPMSERCSLFCPMCKTVASPNPAVLPAAIYEELEDREAAKRRKPRTLLGKMAHTACGRASEKTNEKG